MLLPTTTGTCALVYISDERAVVIYNQEIFICN